MNAGLLKKEDGFSLPYVLFISLLVTSLIISLFTAVYYKNLSEIRLVNKKKLDLACFSAAQGHISHFIRPETGSEKVIIDSVEVSVSYQMTGLFYEVTAAAKKGRDSSSVRYLFANKPESLFDNAVIISQPNLQPMVSGKIKITGDLYSSADRFPRGGISGLDAPPDKFIEGKIKTARNIAIKLFDESVFVIASQKRTISSQVSYDNLEINRSFPISNCPGNFQVKGSLTFNGHVENAKTSGYKKIFTDKPVTFLRNTIVESPLEIFSESKVIIEENSRLENLIIHAKDIEVRPDSKLTGVQLFAAGNIRITKSEILYPSVVFLRADMSDPASLSNTIDISSSTINGTIMLVNSAVGTGNNHTKIKIDESSRIQGLIYSENNLDMRGFLNGIIYTQNFYFYKSPTEYINWLVNLSVNRKALNEWFLMPMGFLKTQNLEILKETWIY